MNDYFLNLVRKAFEDKEFDALIMGKGRYGEIYEDDNANSRIIDGFCELVARNEKISDEVCEIILDYEDRIISKGDFNDKISLLAFLCSMHDWIYEGIPEWYLDLVEKMDNKILQTNLFKNVDMNPIQREYLNSFLASEDKIISQIGIKED